MFSRTLRSSKSSRLWNDRERPARARRSGPQVLISTSPRVIDPPLGRTKPVMASIAVVFPAPLGPMRPTTSPLRTSRLRSCSALVPPKLTETSCRASMVGRGISVSVLRNETRSCSFRRCQRARSGVSQRALRVSSRAARPSGNVGKRTRRAPAPAMANQVATLPAKEGERFGCRACSADSHWRSRVHRGGPHHRGQPIRRTSLR